MIKYNPYLKRASDIIFSIIGLIIFFPLFIVISLLIKLTSNGPVLFKQKRMCENFKPFYLLKFRTMTSSGLLRDNTEFSPGDKSRITAVGSFLRKMKLDELPELFNVLKGDMSIVGPRPEVEKFVNAYKWDYQEILKVKPGLSDFASIKYRNEEDILSKKKEPEKYYLKVVLPDKIKLAKNYLDNVSLQTDIKIIFKTLKRI